MNWTCDYCKSLHPNKQFDCDNCGAPRTAPKTHDEIILWYAGLTTAYCDEVKKKTLITGITYP